MDSKGKLINLMTQHKLGLSEAEKSYLNRMLLNAYEMGMQAGETKAYGKMLEIMSQHDQEYRSLLNRSEISEQFLTILDRKQRR